ncbi:GNAT family N-acetyltransferase [Nisaea acidiphila]|uniref:GNAT family N-acetyltransferase n=1 Tax=Nisaea acidiphila TaxID=1862145 RepID=A0A9J7AWR5_9PROT|nr:GNAT family N-acetyltransferase [Nisaea acidiphila]UUX51566.1 GNAT family N-acetyltransferase [Nisaea acidiphila]
MTAESPDVFVRPVSEDDAAEIVLLLNRIIDAKTYTAMNELMSVADQRHFIRTLPERAVYLAALDGQSGKLLGVQDCLPDKENGAHCDISTFVSLDVFRKGVGSALFERMIAYTSQFGYRQIRAVIRSTNMQALAFYRAAGFRLGRPSNGKTEAVYLLTD